MEGSKREEEGEKVEENLHYEGRTLARAEK